MDDAMFDRLAREFARIVNRRQMAILAGALFSMHSQRISGASQVGPATCGDQGDVCTLISGCCGGLTCATSAINTSYGICVPGEGGMISTGTTLISPFSETAVEDITALIQTESAATAVPTTDPQADREARIAEARAAKEAKRSERRSRLETRRSTQQLREDERHERRVEVREAKKIAFGPELRLELITTTEDDPKTSEDEEVRVDTLEVTNIGNESIVLTRIESQLASKDGISLTTLPSRFTLSPQETYYFVAGLTVAVSTDQRFDWTTLAACDGSPGAGYLVKAAFSTDAENHDYAILCDGPRTIEFVFRPGGKAGSARNNPRLNKKKP